MKITPNVCAMLDASTERDLMRMYGYEFLPNPPMEMVEVPPHHRTLKISPGNNPCYFKIPYTQFYFTNLFHYKEQVIIVTNSYETVYSDKHKAFEPMLANCNLFGYGIGICFHGEIFDSPSEAINYFWNSSFSSPGFKEHTRKSPLRVQLFL